jgi:hypothetical protein
VVDAGTPVVRHRTYVAELVKLLPLIAIPKLVAYRGMGLGKMLMDAVLAHPDLQQGRHFELYCAEGGQRFCLMRKTQ